MAKEIAVFLGPDGSSASQGEAGKVVVFRRAGGSWEKDREEDFSIGQARGMGELRDKMGRMLRFMGACRVFVARSVTGVPYFELEKAGCGVWEIAGRPDEFLEYVWEQEEKEKSAVKAEAAPAIPAPEEKTPGNFYINIKEIQGNNADVSSKMALERFIRRGGFRTLAIICSHVPPWIEVEAMRGGLAFEAERLGMNEFAVRLTKKRPGHNSV